jgi:hypothetical protein
MPNRYLTSNIVSDIKLKCTLPTTSFILTDDEIIRLLTSEQNVELIPFINSLREEYFVITKDIPLVDGILSYDIPARAIGSKLRLVSLLDANNTVFDCPRLAPEQLPATGGQVYNSPFFGHILEYDKIKLYFGQNVQTTQGYTTLRIKYYRKPNDLIKDTDTGIIQSIAGDQISLSFVNPDWAIGTKLDIIKPDPIFLSAADDLVITDISSNTITLAEDVPSNVELGMYAVEAGYTPIPQIPVECFPLLEELGARRAYMSTGDTNGLQISSSAIDNYKKMLLNEYSPRVEGNLIRLFSNNTIFDA